MLPTIEVFTFEPQFSEAFERLNVEWLQKYFRVEPIDREVLADPRRHIIEPGGTILFARVNGEIVGTCALKHEGAGVYELTKMGVTADRQGLGIGAELLGAAIDWFKAAHGRQLYLETNAILKPAIRLYARYGFVDQGQRKPGSVYQRSDVYMIWQAPER